MRKRYDKLRRRYLFLAKGLSFTFMMVGLLSACVMPPRILPFSSPDLHKTIPAFQLGVEKPPGQDQGRKVILGGLILEIQNYPIKTEIEILGKPLDKNGRPVRTGLSSGPILAIYEGYLDRLVYRPGSLITVAGEATGEEIREKYGETFQYTVIEVDNFRLWPPPEAYFSPFWFFPWGNDDRSWSTMNHDH